MVHVNSICIGFDMFIMQNTPKRRWKKNEEKKKTPGQAGYQTKGNSSHTTITIALKKGPILTCLALNTSTIVMNNYVVVAVVP